MAIYTGKQKSTIEYLIARGKAIHKHLKSADNDYDTERYQSELDYIKGELNEALNAEAMFRAHLRVAKEHIEAAEAIRDKWCKA